MHHLVDFLIKNDNEIVEKYSSTPKNDPLAVFHLTWEIDTLSLLQVALLKGISVEDVLSANRKNVEAVYGI